MPHRAVYELSAKSAGGFGRSGALRGILTYELMDDCDGWSVNQKAGLDVTPPEGDPHRFEWSQATWEAKDGTSYRYFIKDSQDGNTGNQRRGELVYAEAGRGRQADDRAASEGREPTCRPFCCRCSTRSS